MLHNLEDQMHNLQNLNLNKEKEDTGYTLSFSPLLYQKIDQMGGIAFDPLAFGKYGHETVRNQSGFKFKGWFSWFQTLRYTIQYR